MNEVLTAIQSMIFLSLSFIHLHWAVGGSFGFESAIPTKENGQNLISPGKMDSAIVGISLLAFSMFYIIKIAWIPLNFPDWLMNYTGWIIPGIFMLRAIGDFKYVGFFKKVRKTKFAEMDTKYYSPLCLIIGTIGLILA